MTREFHYKSGGLRFTVANFFIKMLRVSQILKEETNI
jgi:hypothetical protein